MPGVRPAGHGRSMVREHEALETAGAGGSGEFVERGVGVTRGHGMRVSIDGDAHGFSPGR